MRLARKMLLLVVAAAAVMAVVAPAASATNAISYVKADGKTPCPSVTGAHPTYSDGCVIHLEGEVTLFFHVFGFEGVEAKCYMELAGRLGPSAEGRVTHYHLAASDHDSSCSEAVRPPCTEATASAANRFPWHFSAERDADAVTRIHYDMCVDSVEGAPCEGEQVPAVTEVGALGAETQTQTATDQTLGGSFCEFTLSLVSEAVAPAERVHQRP